MKRALDDEVVPESKRSAPTVISREKFIQTPCSEKTTRDIQSYVLSLVFGDKKYDAKKYVGDRPELCGPLPVSLNRSWLEVVKKESYYVCEKSDGERCMLLMIPQDTRGIPAGSYLINRVFKSSTFTMSVNYAQIISSKGVTLLDGELIIRTGDAGSGTGAEAVYMVFDCLYASGLDCAQQPLNVRLEQVGNSVRLPYRMFEDNLRKSGSLGPPLLILGKFMVPKRDIRSVTSHISTLGEHESNGDFDDIAKLESDMGTDGSTVLRLYKHDSRVNGTDGLVFTPTNVGYRDFFGNQNVLPILKFKFVDELTVDYMLSLEDLYQVIYRKPESPSFLYDVPLRIVVPGNPEFKVAKCKLSRNAAQKYVDVATKLNVDSLIVECAFDSKSSSWEIRRIRDRKSKANFIITAWSTLESIAENMDMEEVVNALSK